MKGLRVWLLALPLILSCASVSYGEKVYVTDTFKITLRTGPSTDNKILVMLGSGEALDRLEEQDGWSHVRVAVRGEEAVEGWVLSRYLIAREPWKAQAEAWSARAQDLRQKLDALRADHTACEKEKARVSQELQDKTRAFDLLKRQHDTLKAGARDFLDLKAAYQADRKALARARKQIASLKKVNERLASSERTRWFATGAGVLLLGLILGMVVGRRKKRRSSLYD